MAEIYKGIVIWGEDLMEIPVGQAALGIEVRGFRAPSYQIDRDVLEELVGEIVDRLIQPLAVSYDHRVIDGALTLGQLVQFNVFVALLVWPLRMIGMTIAFAQRAAAALGRVNEVLDTDAHLVILNAGASAGSANDPGHSAGTRTGSPDGSTGGGVSKKAVAPRSFSSVPTA